MIYYGLQILNPEYFLIASCCICAIVSIASGSSWSLLRQLGLHLLVLPSTWDSKLVAGAIISGSIFGDKMSPLFHTTNLAAAMSSSNLFSHIKYMMYTTIPSFIISIIIFFYWMIYRNTTTQNINDLLIALENKFNINYWLFLVPLIVVF